MGKAASEPIPFAGSQLGATRHVCAFFRNADEEYRVLLPFIQDGFESGDRAVHIVDPKLRNEHLRRLASAGIDVAVAERNGRLRLSLLETRGPSESGTRSERFLVVCGDRPTKRTSIVGIFSIAMMASVLMPLTVMGQQKSLKDQLVGTWIYVSSTAKRDDGSYEPRPSLQGAVTYTADGRFHFITTRTDAPKYASGVLARPSPDEAMAIASSALAYTGTYTVDEGTRTIHVNIETGTFPNLVGAPNQRRIVTSLIADEMKFTNPRTSAGLTLEIVWKRAK